MKTNSSSVDLSVLLLTLLFIGLKLGKVIDWSWWWVLSPLWISFSIAMLFVIGAIAFVAWRELK